MPPRGRKRQLQGDVTQRRLMECLVELLDEGVSFSQVSVEEITRRAGITRPGFYFHFASREEALLAAVDEVVASMIDAARVFLDSETDSPLRELELALDAAGRIRFANRNLMRAFTEAAAAESNVWRRLREAVESLATPITSRIRTIRERRGLPLSQSEAEDLARTLLWANHYNNYRATVEGFNQAQWSAMRKTMLILWTSSIFGVDVSSGARREHARRRSK